MSVDDTEVRARALGTSFDLLATYEGPGGFFFERAGLGLSAAMNERVRSVEAGDLAGLARAASEAFRSIGPGDGSGLLPVAVGALPFAARADPILRIPGRVTRRTAEGETWLMDLGRAFDPIPPFVPERVRPDLPSDAFRAMQLQEVPSAAEYAGAVAEVTRLIADGKVSKVVLARTLGVRAGRALDPKRLLHRLRAAEPHGFVFAAPVAANACLAGASPELLVSRRGSAVASTPLAGSAPRSGDPDEDRSHADELLASSKNRREHAVVVEAVAETLAGFCDDLTFDREPVLLPTANVWHLATRFRGVLADPETTALDLVAELHPTPAVCGTPRSEAVDIIARSEPFDRGSYAGPVGWTDASGDGEWAIALRCAELAGERATLYAGAGIVQDSDPESEVDETERKFRAFLDSLRWG